MRDNKIISPVVTILNRKAPNSTYPLIENNKPFRYTIDKLIDKNPGTSFVENNPNDEMVFTFFFKNPINTSTITIINGYAKNEDLYFKNNQVKKIRIASQTQSFDFTLKQTMEFQNLDVDFNNTTELSFEVLDVYKGKRWNDTCIAEVNFFINGQYFF